jgi:hypothetical protein
MLEDLKHDGPAAHCAMLSDGAKPKAEETDLHVTGASPSPHSASPRAPQRPAAAGL